MKNLFLILILLISISSLSLAQSPKPPAPKTRCFDVQIQAEGAYVLGVKINNNRNCKVGNGQTASMTMGESKTFKVSDRANVKLGAWAGKNTMIQIHDNGKNDQKIRCFGSTQVGFGCKYYQ